jgi:hypothetical protein
MPPNPPQRLALPPTHTARTLFSAKDVTVPGISEGRRLLMHELTHVVQQSRRDAAPSAPLRLDDPDSPAERAAVRSSEAALTGKRENGVLEVSPGPGVIQRQQNTAETGGTGSDPTFSAAATNITQAAAPGPDAQQSQWNVEDSQLDFWISKQVGWGASFRTATFGKAKGPGFTTWSNPDIFNIIPNEHVWLRSNYWADTLDHPIPWDKYKPAVFNEIKFTPANGGAAVNVRYQDEHPTYNGPGKALGVKLGSMSPAPEAAGLPIHDLPMNGGGSLVWTAGFRFGSGGWNFSANETFRLQSAGSPVSVSPDATSSGPANTGAATAGPAPETSGRKGTPLPPPPPPVTSKKSADDAKVREIQIYTEGVKKAQEAVSRDELVRKLRDALSSIQPFLPQKDAQKMIDDALRSLVKEGIDSGIKAILQAITGKSPKAMPEDRSQIGPYPPSGVKGTQIITSPAIPIPDTPKPRSRTSFGYKGLRKSYLPGETMKFTVLPPQKSETMTGKRVVIVADADRDKVNPDKLAGPTPIRDTDTDVEFKAPESAGKYVVRIDIGMNFDYSSTFDFEVQEVKK